MLLRTATSKLMLLISIYAVSFDIHKKYVVMTGGKINDILFYYILFYVTNFIPSLPYSEGLDPFSYYLSPAMLN